MFTVSTPEDELVKGVLEPTLRLVKVVAPACKVLLNVTAPVTPKVVPTVAAPVTLQLLKVVAPADNVLLNVVAPVTPSVPVTLRLLRVVAPAAKVLLRVVAPVTPNVPPTVVLPVTDKLDRVVA